MAAFKDRTYYRIYYRGKNGIVYTDPYHDKDYAIELYCRYIEKYSEVALVEVKETKKIVMGSLGD